jgi:hypothetical protein
MGENLSVIVQNHGTNFIHGQAGFAHYFLAKFGLQCRKLEFSLRINADDGLYKPIAQIANPIKKNDWLHNT